jgi:hypothetical protein
VDHHWRDGAILILQASASAFYIAGAGLTDNFARHPDVEAGIRWA